MTNSVIDPQSMEWYEDTYFGYDLLTWKFKSTNDYEGTIYANDNTIYAISFDPLLVRPVVNLSQAITAYGEPEIIFSREVATNPDFGDLFFLYPEKGIWFASLQALELYDFRDELRPETPIRYIVYVFPDEFENVFETMVIYDYQNFGISPEAIQNSFHEWKGYGVISELYPAGTD